MKKEWLIVIPAMVATTLIAWLNNSESNIEPVQSDQCKPYGKGIGPMINYPLRGNNMKGEVYSFVEYQTAAAYKLRIPAFMGTMSQPNQQCELKFAEFRYRWVNGALVRDFDIATGKEIRDGNLVEFHAWFSSSDHESTEEKTLADWQLLDSFTLPGHEQILFLPFAGIKKVDAIPQDRRDRTTWKPRFLVKNISTWNSDASIFRCSEIKFTESYQGLRVDIVGNRTNQTARCMAYLRIGAESGGRLDLYGENLLENLAPITLAVVKEINSYIVREPKE